MLTIKTFVFNDFQENTYLLYDNSNTCTVIDPGMGRQDEKDEFDNFIAENKLKLTAIINTHCHVDHVLGSNYLKKKYDIPFYIHASEIKVLEKAQIFGEFFGMQVEAPPSPDYFLADGDLFNMGDSELRVLHVPGHSEGSIALYCVNDNMLITGDVLFRGSIGRTDLPGGDYNTLITSIKSKIMILPGNVQVFPGHGPSTSIQNERNSNPFLI
jgi:hydroxyacylglutathione hydrolase